MSDLDEVKEAQNEVSQNVHLLRQQADKLEKEKIGPSELKSFEERLAADTLPKIEKRWVAQHPLARRPAVCPNLALAAPGRIER